MKPVERVLEKPLECPVPHNKRYKWWAWLKQLGFWGFMFFLIKGVVLYILLPYLIAKGFWK